MTWTFRGVVAIAWLLASLLAALWPLGLSARDENPGGAPVVVGLIAGFGLPNSTSAQSIELGIRVAMAEINEAGGVLEGRPLVLETRDDRSVPARALQHLRELIRMPELVAVFNGRFSPVAIELLPIIHEARVILLNPWASADGVTDHGYRPSYSFRVSLRDRLAIPTMLEHARQRGLSRVGLLVPGNDWGRSNHRATGDFIATQPEFTLVATHWYHLGDRSLVEAYRQILAAGADVLLLVANDREAAILLREMVALPATERLPVLSHWGVTGGRFFEAVHEALDVVDFAVVQTFSFATADPRRRARFMHHANALFGIDDPDRIPAPVGAGHAYDLVHLLARAIDRAGTSRATAVRDALERLDRLEGLVAVYDPPFTPTDHDALKQSSVFMARYRDDGVLVAVPRHDESSGR